MLKKSNIGNSLMGKLRDDQLGFSAVEGLLIVLIIVVIGLGGYYVWHSNKTSKNSTTTTSSSSNTSRTTSNQYSGWKSYTLTDEKLSFQYPSTWQVKDYTNSGTGNQDYHADWVVFTASDGFEFDINDGLSGGDPLSFISNYPVAVTYVGQSAYMVFSNPGNPGAPGSVNSSEVAGFVLLTNPNDQTSVPNNKNVTVNMASYYSASASSSTSTTPGQMLITGSYGTNKYFSSVEQAMQDKEYQNSKLVIESMHY